MQHFHPSDLKTIIHSKRANIYYLHYCRVLVNGGRVEYVMSAANRNLYWNIPIANTTVLLLGTGTSITQAAMRELAKAGIFVGFCRGGGTPLFHATECEVDVADLVKDALVLLQAFLSAVKGDNEQEFRHTCIENFTQAKVLDYMIDTIKDSALTVSGG